MIANCLDEVVEMSIVFSVGVSSLASGAGVLSSQVVTLQVERKYG